MQSEYLTFGVTKKGDWVSIDEVGRGQSSLFCPFCKSLLIAKKGLTRIHHFVHEADSCVQLFDALKACQIPTIDTFEMLDEQESRYLENREKYQHSDIHDWPGMHEAILRLSTMGILVVDNEVDSEITAVANQLKQVDPELFTECGQPSEKLNKLFAALKPFANLKKHWENGEEITATQVNHAYHANRLIEQTTIEQLERAQCYWLDAFCKRQRYLFPEYHSLLSKKLTALNHQCLYVMELVGDFPNCPKRFIKIGMTSRHINFRLTEIRTDLDKLGTLESVNVLVVVDGAGRLEKLIHQHFEQQRIQLGNHLEFFNESVKTELLEVLESIATIKRYSPPVFEPILVANSPGRKKKSASQLLADYPEVVSALNTHKMSVRKACRETGRASATVQKVKKAMHL